MQDGLFSHSGQGTSYISGMIGNKCNSSSEDIWISKRTGGGRINLINCCGKAKTPIVVCLDNNYDTGVFAFFSMFYLKSDGFYVSPTPYGDELF